MIDLTKITPEEAAKIETVLRSLEGEVLLKIKRFREGRLMWLLSDSIGAFETIDDWWRDVYKLIYQKNIEEERR